MDRKERRRWRSFYPAVKFVYLHRIYKETCMLICMICCSLSNAPTSSLSRSS